MIKKASLLTVLLLIPTLVFALTSTANMQVSAYKEAAEIPPTVTYISIKDLTSGTNITGLDNLFNLESTNIQNLFSITITSNQTSPINMTLILNPFANQNNRQIIMPVTYSLTRADTPRVVGESHIYYWNRKYYYAEYTPSIQVNGQTSWQEYISSTTSISLVYRPDGNVRIGNKKKNDSNISNWEESTLSNVQRLSNNYSNTLPCLSNSQNLIATAVFGLSISENDYKAIIANTDYVTTITVHLESL